MALHRLRRGLDRLPTSELVLSSGASFPDLVERLRLGEREAFEELFDVFFLYVHHHVELSSRLDGLPVELREQVTEAALFALFEELMDGAGDDSDRALPGISNLAVPEGGEVGPAAEPPWAIEPCDGAPPRHPTSTHSAHPTSTHSAHPTWTRRALDLAAAAQRSLLDRRRMPRAR